MAGSAVSFQLLLHISWAPTLCQALGWPWGHRQGKDVVPACTPPALPAYLGRQTPEEAEAPDRHINGGISVSSFRSGIWAVRKKCFRQLFIQIGGLFVTQHHFNQSSRIHGIVAGQGLALTQW